MRLFGPETLRGKGARAQLKEFQDPCPSPAGKVLPFENLPEPAPATFGSFAEAMAADGFSFLHGQMQTGSVGPVLVAVRNDCVAGAIALMEIRPDVVGAAQLMHQYFEVLPE